MAAAAASASPCVTGLVKVVFLFLVLVAAVCGPVGASAYDFDVGGEHGWVVPPSNNTRVYNQWASKNRFRIGDSLVFKYKKDSVMMVTEEEYDHCNAKQPIFFYNNGNTEVELDHAGIYYFISGLREHCEKGQKMIVRVLGHSEDRRTSSPPGGNQTDQAAPPAGKSSAFQASLVQSVVFMAGTFFFFSCFFF
ncbi:hypothetical protein Taro_029939 [Colocasia esculenta]|uniref:Phytocyanin domain-containing protein n=1 Tax=Colocasia esculenta TaxID=4460 RepID=A0A843VUN4_COLES|nr:hypothetical protein [Colocasia esculenta]